MKKIKLISAGVCIGIINSLFGSGGGLIAVPLLKKQGFSQKAAQANSIAVILPLSAVSTVMYLHKEYFSLRDGIVYLPFGFIGAFIGTRLIKKISGKSLKHIFSCLLIYSGARILFGQ